MNRLFRMDSPIVRFMDKVGALIIANVLWLICSLPIVTIGASTTALYYVTLRMARNTDSHVKDMFFKSFKQNLKQGVILTLIYGFLIGFLIFDIRVVMNLGNFIAGPLMIFLLIVLVILIMIVCYTFPVLAQFDNSTKKTVSNAFLFAVSKPLKAVAVTLLSMLPVILLMLSPRLFIASSSFWACLFVGVIAYINTMLLIPLFAPFMPEEETDETDEEMYGEMDDSTYV